MWHILHWTTSWLTANGSQISLKLLIHVQAKKSTLVDSLVVSWFGEFIRWFRMADDQNDSQPASHWPSPWVRRWDGVFFMSAADKEPQFSGSTNFFNFFLKKNQEDFIVHNPFDDCWLRTTKNAKPTSYAATIIMHHRLLTANQPTIIHHQPWASKNGCGAIFAYSSTNGGKPVIHHKPFVNRWWMVKPSICCLPLVYRPLTKSFAFNHHYYRPLLSILVINPWCRSSILLTH